jgi:uncharacterized membrane protein YgdD (TMEM256/DUF423 family)
MNARSTLLAAGLFGASGVGLGALGAHALEPFLSERGMAHAWDTAARYHIIHAVALLAIAVWQRQARGAAARLAGWAARCWTIGIILFSGSLDGLALGGPRWLGPVTPLGGVALIAGWVCLAAAAFAKDE